jgi:hypothetical protein
LKREEGMDEMVPWLQASAPPFYVTLNYMAPQATGPYLSYVSPISFYDMPSFSFILHECLLILQGQVEKHSLFPCFPEISVIYSPKKEVLSPVHFLDETLWLA